MVRSVRDAEAALGDGALDEPKQSGRVFARSLYSARDIKKGELISEDCVACVRPGYGLAPNLKKEILGKKAVRDIEFATALNLNMFE